MKTFIIEYEIPPMRAIHQCECDCETEREAKMAFQTGMPDEPSVKYIIRKIYEKGESLEQCGDGGGYLCDVHGNTGHTGDYHKAPVGDRGQRYMVVADFDGKENPIGYTNNPTDGSLLEGAKKWPACTNPRVIDRTTPINPCGMKGRGR